MNFKSTPNAFFVCFIFRWSEQCLVHYLRGHHCHGICWYYHYSSCRNNQVRKKVVVCFSFLYVSKISQFSSNNHWVTQLKVFHSQKNKWNSIFSKHWLTREHTSRSMFISIEWKQTLPRHLNWPPQPYDVHTIVFSTHILNMKLKGFKNSKCDDNSFINYEVGVPNIAYTKADKQEIIFCWLNLEL